MSISRFAVLIVLPAVILGVRPCPAQHHHRGGGGGPSGGHAAPRGGGSFSSLFSGAGGFSPGGWGPYLQPNTGRQQLGRNQTIRTDEIYQSTGVGQRLGRNQGGRTELGHPKPTPFDWQGLVKQVAPPLIDAAARSRSSGGGRTYQWQDYYTPQQPNYVQQATYVAPPGNAMPQPIASNPPPPTNAVPQATASAAPKPNAVPPKAVQTPKNFALTGKLRAASAGEIQDWKKETETDVDKNAQQMRDLVASDGQINADAGALPPGVDREAIAKAAKEGDVDRVKDLLGAASGTASGKQVLADASARKAIDNAAELARKGQLTEADGTALGKALIATGRVNPVNSPYLVSSYTHLEDDSKLMDRLSTAVAGGLELPGGSDGTIILVGGMESGEGVSLGNGAVLLGAGDAMSGIAAVEGSTAEVLGVCQGTGQPEPETEAAPVAGGTVLLLNSGAGSVNYTLNGQPFAMEPNYTQTLPAGQAWTVEFDRGNGQGVAQYQLADGTFEFTSSGQGWELQQKKYTLTVDNSVNRVPFNYLVNDDPQTLAVGQTQEHSGAYPIVIRFDNGAGQVRQKQFQGGTCRVALAPDNTLDLFEPSDVRAPIPVAELAKPRKVNLFGSASDPSPVAASRPAAKKVALFGSGGTP